MKFIGKLVIAFLALAALFTAAAFVMAEDWAEQKAKWSRNQGARSCFDTWEQKNIGFDHTHFKQFKECLLNNRDHPQNRGREFDRALEFWTPDMVEYARYIDGRGGGSSGSAGARETGTTFTFEPVDPVKIYTGHRPLPKRVD